VCSLEQENTRGRYSYKLNICRCMLSIPSHDYVFMILVSTFIGKTIITFGGRAQCERYVPCYIRYGRTNLHLQHCLRTCVARYKPHKELGNEVYQFSQPAVSFLPLTCHAVKQTASYLNSAVHTTGDGQNTPRRRVYPHLFICTWVIILLAIYLSLGHYLCELYL